MLSQHPDGYVSFNALAKELYREGGFHEKWNTGRNLLESGYGSKLFSDYLKCVELRKNSDKPLSRLESNLAVEIGLFWITLKNLRTSGIDLETGDLLRIPESVWLYSRKSSGSLDYNAELIEGSLLGNNIAIPSLTNPLIFSSLA